MKKNTRSNAMRIEPSRNHNQAFRHRARNRPTSLMTASSHHQGRFVLLSTLLLWWCPAPIATGFLTQPVRYIVPCGMSILNKENEHEVERYRNRSKLLETTLKHKLEALKLSDKKLVVLQDAVKRLVKKQEKEQELHKKELEQEHHQQLDAQLSELEHWKIKHKRSESARLEAVRNLENLKRQFEETQSKYKQQRDDLAADMRDLETRYRNDKNTWQQSNDAARTLKEQLRELQTSYEESRKEMEFLMETAPKTNDKLKKSVAVSEAHIKQLEGKLEKETNRSKSWKQKYSKATESIQSFEKDLLESQKSSVSSDDTAKEVQQLKAKHDEAMEIAQSAVAASERREAKLKQELEESKTTCSNLLAQKTDLQRLFEELKEIEASEERHSKTLQFELGKMQKDYSQLMAQKTHMQRRLKVLEAKLDKANEQFQSSARKQPVATQPTATEPSNVNSPSFSESKREPLQDILEHATQVVGEKQPKKSTKERLVEVASTLRPGRVGQYFEEHDMTFEKDTTSRWRYVKNLLPRIPFRIVRRTQHHEQNH